MLYILILRLTAWLHNIRFWLADKLVGRELEDGRRAQALVNDVCSIMVEQQAVIANLEPELEMVKKSYKDLLAAQVAGAPWEAARFHAMLREKNVEIMDLQARLEKKNANKCKCEATNA